MTTTVKIPLELLTVQVNSATTFWMAKSGTNLDQAHIAFADSLSATATYWAYVPNNVAATPAWNLDAYHYADSGSGGTAIISIYAKAESNSSTIDVAPTLLVSSASITVNTSNVMNYTALSGGNFDSVVALSATNYVYIEVLRSGGATGDTVNAQWDLAALVMRCDVT